METNLRDSLDEARRAFKSKEYAVALDKYNYFFDHALDHDPSALYGVRLSYCLDEWAKLGEEFPEAKVSLERKKEQALELLKETKEPERFHDYIAICKYLNCSEQAITKFIELHELDKNLAKVIVRFIWNQLMDKELWHICIIYLDDYLKKYESCLIKFDQAMGICKSDESLGGVKFESQIKGWYVRDITNILLVFKNCDKQSKFNEILKLVEKDTVSRGYPELKREVFQSVDL